VDAQRAHAQVEAPLCTKNRHHNRYQNVNRLNLQLR
jgi:hypothetical protein